MTPSTGGRNTQNGMTKSSLPSSYRKHIGSVVEHDRGMDDEEKRTQRNNVISNVDEPMDSKLSASTELLQHDKNSSQKHGAAYQNYKLIQASSARTIVNPYTEGTSLEWILLRL